MQYYEEMGKPTPKVEVMRFLKGKQYTDAKDFAGEFEPVVVIAKGQSQCSINFQRLIFLFFINYLKKNTMGCRCARDVQIRDPGRLHIGISRCPVSVRSRFLLRLVLEGHLGPPHCQSRPNAWRWDPHRRCRDEEAAAT